MLRFVALKKYSQVVLKDSKALSETVRILKSSAKPQFETALSGLQAFTALEGNISTANIQDLHSITSWISENLDSIPRNVSMEISQKMAEVVTMTIPMEFPVGETLVLQKLILKTNQHDLHSKLIHLFPLISNVPNQVLLNALEIAFKVLDDDQFLLFDYIEMKQMKNAPVVKCFIQHCVTNNDYLKALELFSTFVTVNNLSVEKIDSELLNLIDSILVKLDGDTRVKERVGKWLKSQRFALFNQVRFKISRNVKEAYTFYTTIATKLDSETRQRSLFCMFQAAMKHKNNELLAKLQSQIQPSFLNVELLICMVQFVISRNSNSVGFIKQLPVSDVELISEYAKKSLKFPNSFKMFTFLACSPVRKYFLHEIDLLKQAMPDTIPEIKIWTAIIYDLVERQDVFGAISTFESLIDKGIKPDITLCTVILNALAETTDLHQVNAWLHKMETEGFKWDSPVYGVLLKLQSIINDFDEFKNLLNQMYSSRLYLNDLEVYNLVFHIKNQRFTAFLWDFLQEKAQKMPADLLEIFFIRLTNDQRIEHATKILDYCIQKKIKLDTEQMTPYLDYFAHVTQNVTELKDAHRKMLLVSTRPEHLEATSY